MKMRVQRGDGRIETISLVGPCEVHHGEGMDHIHSADGMDYYFLHDGTYDGCGAGVPGGTTERTMDMVERVERERAIEDSS